MSEKAEPQKQDAGATEEGRRTNVPNSDSGGVANSAGGGAPAVSLEALQSENAALRVLAQAYMPKDVKVNDELAHVTAAGLYRKPVQAQPVTPTIPATPAPTVPNDGRSAALESMYRQGFITRPANEQQSQ